MYQLYNIFIGLELQETSCHSLEVTRIDDIFQETFERNSALNYFAFHTLTPLLSLPVSMYSSSKNILTGIIESPDTLILISKVFSKTLIWYYVKTILDKIDHMEEKQSTVIKVLIIYFFDGRSLSRHKQGALMEHFLEVIAPLRHWYIM